ncbi:glycosyltransferase [Yaniella flava]
MLFTFLAVSGETGSLDQEIRHGGHQVEYVEIKNVRDIWRAARLMKRSRLRVVHSHLGVASGPVILAAWIARVPIRIAHSRSDAVGGATSGSRRIYLAFSRLLVSALATAVLGVSPAALEGSGLLRGRWRSRAQVIPNGLDAIALRKKAQVGRDKRKLDSRDRLVIANVARLERSKNRKRAIDIWANVALHRPSTLKLVGPLNEDEATYAARIAVDDDISRMGSNIEIIGESPKVAEHLGESDVLLVTSSREGLPGVVLEALACGTPVVSTNLPGVEWIKSYTEGIDSLDLAESDETWAKALLRASEGRAAIHASFLKSPFQISRAVEEHLRVWGLQ